MDPTTVAIVPIIIVVAGLHIMLHCTQYYVGVVFTKLLAWDHELVSTV